MAERTPRAAPGADAVSGAQTEPGTEAAAAAAVIIKKYANRRLYNTEASTYVTLEDLAGMVRLRRHFLVYDAKSGEDITRSVLTQIIVEEESKGRSLLPEKFLRQLIGFYGDSLQTVLPRYLEFAMAGFSRQQEQLRRSMETTIGGFLPLGGGFPGAFGGLEEVGKQNMAMLERAMSLFAPFRPADPGAVPPGTPTGTPSGIPPGLPPGLPPGTPARDNDPAVPPAAPAQRTLAALENEVEALKRQLAALQQAADGKARSG